MTKKTLYLLSLSALLGACSPYSINTLSTSEAKINDQVLSVDYVFDKKGSSLVYLSLENTSGEPIEIDWVRSSLVLNQEAHSLLPTQFSESTINLDSWKYDRRTTTIDGTSNIQTKTTSEITFLPPHSTMKRPLEEIGQYFDRANIDSALRADKFHGPQGTISIQKAEFTESNSPLKLMSYITYTHQSQKKTHTKSYFVSKTIDTFTQPKVISGGKGPDAKTFYFRK